jgi:proteic killer suppression protein
VIVSFADAATEALFQDPSDRRALRFTPDIVKTALRKLDMLDAAHELLDLRAPPGNRLEALRGDLRGHHSMRVNAQWRVVFRWTALGPADVCLTDYH